MLFGRIKKRSDVPSEEIRGIMQTLRQLARVEKNIAEFYHRCARLIPGEKEFWEGLAESEHRHSATIHRLHEMIGDHPERFRPGRPFDPAAIRIFEVFVLNLVEEIDLAGLSRKELVDHALNIENSAIELHYHQIVKSRDPEFMRLAEEIDADTQEHVQAIRDRAAGT